MRPDCNSHEIHNLALHRRQRSTYCVANHLNHHIVLKTRNRSGFFAILRWYAPIVPTWGKRKNRQTSLNMCAFAEGSAIWLQIAPMHPALHIAACTSAVCLPVGYGPGGGRSSVAACTPSKDRARQGIILNSTVGVWYWPILVNVFTQCRLV